MFSFIMGVVAKGNIPANSYVCEFKTNLICDKATFDEKVKEYFYKMRQSLIVQGGMPSLESKLGQHLLPHSN